MSNAPHDDRSSLHPPRGPLSRRTLMKGAAWAVPAVAVAVAVPIAAASTPGVPKAFSSWGTTDGSISCWNCSGRAGKYTWSINNTWSSGLNYYGVLFPNAQVGQVYSNVINVYWLPFKSGAVSQGAGAPNWTKLAYDASYGTITGPNNVPYYAWVTTFAGSVTVRKQDIDRHGVFHLTPDYQFKVTGDSCVDAGDLYVSHAYTYSLNGQQMSNCTGSYHGNYCGGSGNYPDTTDGSSNWRNNGWVGPLADGCSSFGRNLKQDVASPQATSPSTDTNSTTGPWYI